MFYGGIHGLSLSELQEFILDMDSVFAHGLQGTFNLKHLNSHLCQAWKQFDSTSRMAWTLKIMRWQVTCGKFWQLFFSQIVKVLNFDNVDKFWFHQRRTSRNFTRELKDLRLKSHGYDFGQLWFWSCPKSWSQLPPQGHLQHLLGGKKKLRLLDWVLEVSYWTFCWDASNLGSNVNMSECNLSFQTPSCRSGQAAWAGHLELCRKVSQNWSRNHLLILLSLPFPLSRVFCPWNDGSLRSLVLNSLENIGLCRGWLRDCCGLRDSLQEMRQVSLTAGLMTRWILVCSLLCQLHDFMLE